MVLTLEAKRQQDEAERAGGDGGLPGAPQQIPNSEYQPGGGSFSGETVTYVNEGLTEEDG